MFRGRDSTGEPKYISRSKALVVDNRDPMNKGRIIVNSPVLGITTWIHYLRLPHQFDVPSIGDIVYVECEAGEYEFAIAWGNLTKGLDGSPEIPEQFKRDVPSNRGMYTPGGHLVEMDDGESNITNSPVDTNLSTKNRGFRITSSANNKIHIIEDSENSQQYILIEDANGNLIKLDYKNNSLTINSIGNTNQTVGGNSTIDCSGNTDQTIGGNSSINCSGNSTQTIGGNSTIDCSGNSEQTIGGNLNINITGNCTIKATGNTIVDGTTIKLGEMAIEAMVKGTTFKALFDAHTHPTIVGPSGPPTAPLDPSALSIKVTTE